MRADGSIVINVDVIADDAEKEIQELQEEIESKEKSIANLQKEQAKAIKERDSALKKVNKEMDSYVKKERNLKNLEEKQNPLIAAAEAKKAEIATAQKELSEINSNWRKGLGDSGYGEKLEEISRLKQGYAEILSDIEKYDEKILKVSSVLDEQKQKLDAVSSEWERAKTSVGEYEQKIQDSTKTVEALKIRAVEIAQQFEEARQAEEIRLLELKSLEDQKAKAAARTASATEAMAAAQAYAEDSMRRFGLRLKEVVRSALIFTVISQSVAKLREWLGKVIKTNDEAQKSFAQLKGALLTLAQPLVEVLIPALITLANVMTRVTLAVAQLMSMLFGKTISQSQEAAKSLNEEVTALEGVERASEDAGESIASFDEINKLSSGASGSGAAESETPSFDFDLESQEGKLNGILGLITAIGAGLLAWKLGDTLLKKLKIFAGLMVAIGGGILMAKNLWDAWQNGLNMGNLIGVLTGALLLVTGLAIAFGRMGAIIGLIVTGVLMLATAFHDAMENGWNFQNTLLAIAGLVATGLGISMLTGSVIPLLIAAIASFILALVVAYGDGEALIDGFKDIFGGLKDFVVGIFTGELTRAFEGLESVFEGFGTVFEVVIDAIKNIFLSFLNWLDEKTGGKFHGIIETAKTIISSFAEGTKKIFSGLMDTIQRIFEGIINFIVGVFTADWDRAFNGLASVVTAFKDLVVGIFEKIVAFIKEKVGTVINWAKNALKNLDPDLSKTTYTSRSVSTFSLANVPALANGAVIPPNREFLAVLGDQKSGTNVEAPLSTIEQAVENVLNRRGDGGFGDGTVTVVVNLDGKEVARNQVKHINDMTRAAGKPVLLL